MREISNITEILNHSKEGGKLGLMYSKDLLLGGEDTFLVDLLLGEGTSSDEGKTLKDIKLNEGFYLDDETNLVGIKKGTMAVFENVINDKVGLIGDIVIGTLDDKNVIGSILIMEDGDRNYLADKAYLL